MGAKLFLSSKSFELNSASADRTERFGEDLAEEQILQILLKGQLLTCRYLYPLFELKYFVLDSVIHTSDENQ